MRGLIIKKKWLDLILSGDKTWEIRGTNTTIRGEIFLIESGAGAIVGKCNIINSFNTNIEELKIHHDKHLITDLSLIKYNTIYAWEFKNAKKLKKRIPYSHPQGAVIWVKLGEINENTN